MSRKFVRQYGEIGVLCDPTLGIVFDWGTTVPADTTIGYAPGAIFIDVDAAGGLQIWVNEGTLASSSFKVVPSGASGTFTTLTATTATITTLNATTINGTTIAFTGRMTTTDGVASGTARVVGGLAYSSTAASTAVASTSAETAYDVSYTVPANTFKAGTVMKVKYTILQTTEVGADTFIHKLYIGGSSGSVIASSGAAAAGANSAIARGESTLICRTAGATGTMVAYGEATTPVTAGTATVVRGAILNSTTLNTTTSQAIVVTGTWNTANANSTRLDLLTVEIY